MPGGFEIQDSYSFSNKRRQKTKESTYFRERFGRNDFEDLNTERALGGAVTYILKYIEKSGEKIVYSRDLPQFFIGDIMENDIASPIGIEFWKNCPLLQVCFHILFSDFISPGFLTRPLAGHLAAFEQVQRRGLADMADAEELLLVHYLGNSEPHARQSS